jgi:hypothetical protein
MAWYSISHPNVVYDMELFFANTDTGKYTSVLTGAVVFNSCIHIPIITYDRWRRYMQEYQIENGAFKECNYGAFGTIYQRYGNVRRDFKPYKCSKESSKEARRFINIKNYNKFFNLMIELIMMPDDRTGENVKSLLLKN